MLKLNAPYNSSLFLLVTPDSDCLFFPTAVARDYNECAAQEEVQAINFSVATWP
jgi:hypothetical protein